MVSGENWTIWKHWVPRFKISHYTNWDEAYPGADYPITEGEGKYEIIFNEETKKITATKLDSPPPRVHLMFTTKSLNMSR